MGNQTAIRSNKDFKLPSNLKYSSDIDETYLGRECITLEEIKSEIEEQEAALKKIAILHALDYLDLDSKMKNKILEKARSGDISDSAYVGGIISQNLRSINSWLARFIFSNGVELVWSIPKFVHFYRNLLTVPGKKDMHIVCPVFKSKYFDVSPKLQNGEHYILGRIDFDSALFTSSKLGVSYIKNLAMTLQGYCEKDKTVKGAALIITGSLTKELNVDLLNWFRGSTLGEPLTTDISPVPDVEIIYAAPGLKSLEEFLFSLKPNRGDYRLKKHNDNSTFNRNVRGKLKSTLETRRIRMIIDEIIVEASEEKNNFKKNFWNGFEKRLNPYQTLELPSKQDLSNPDLQNNLRIRLHKPELVLSSTVIQLANMTIVDGNITKELHPLDWNHIIEDDENHKNYTKQDYTLLENVTLNMLDNANQYFVFSRSPALLTLRSSDNNIQVNVGAIFGFQKITDKWSKLPKLKMLELTIISIALIFSQFKESLSTTTEITTTCTHIINIFYDKYNSRLSRLASIAIGRSPDEDFKDLISDPIQSPFVNQVFANSAVKFFFETLNEELQNKRNNVGKNKSQDNIKKIVNHFEEAKEVLETLNDLVLFDNFKLTDISKLLKAYPSQYVSIPKGDIRYLIFHNISQKLKDESHQKMALPVFVL